LMSPAEWRKWKNQKQNQEPTESKPTLNR
jgi:hypothetical protein